MTEQQIEQQLIDKLQDLKYSYRHDIRDRAMLEANFRQKFEELNQVKLTDAEFSRLLETIITSDVYAASNLLRNRNTFEREDGSSLNYTLVNIKDWCKNTFEVVNQLRINSDNSNHRYDVILLINGVPMVQIELKTLAVTPRRAMQQIIDYKNDPGNGYSRTLMCFIQLFIVSNRSDTWYFANNNNRHFSFDADERFLPYYRYAGEDNKKITQFDDFCDRFLAKCTLGQLLSRYMVLVASEQKLLMMRPYQIYAVKAIVDCIQPNCGNGYIWHTTGSGKTLTSFKASTLLKDNPNIDKCLFVVDRKDLDRQTREEFNRFQEGCVEENTDTATLVDRLLSDEYADKVIVTTIQKLGLALDGNNRRSYKERLEPLRESRVVFIFDECHRSQFGENHQAIKEFFPNAQLFGFTGTPIFERNSTSKQADGDEGSYRTTESIFQKELHAYTITNAIDDGNVLKFHVDFYGADTEGKPRPGATVTKRAVVDAILAKHNAATNERKFNAIFATASINDAIEYFNLFQSVQAELQEADPSYTPINIACVFSPPAEGNPDAAQFQEDLPQERADNAVDPHRKKAVLKTIIDDYNNRYNTNHRVEEFDQYYQDVQKRIKDHQYPNSEEWGRKDKVDVVIVVDMLLTGFDSKYLNTLYVDKNLKYHGLIQAFSRTNRVLNHTKPYGNILDFRCQKDAVDKAIELFSGKLADRAKEVWLVDKAPVVIEQLEQAVKELADFMQSQGVRNKPEDVANLAGDAARGQFVNLFKEVQRLKTQLDQYTDLSDEQKEAVERVMSKDELQGFRGVYLETAHLLKAEQDKDQDTASPEVQNLDFEFVLFASALIDYDYIVSLLAQYSAQTPGKVIMSREQLIGLIASDSKFMDEREDITSYIRTLKEGEGLSEEAIKAGYVAFKNERNEAAVAAVAAKHRLEVSALQSFVDGVVRRRIFDGEQLSELLEPLELGWKARTQKELDVVEDLAPLLRKLVQGREISGLNAYER